MELTINGESRTHPDGLSVADLLARMELNPAFVAVEVNRQLVTRRRHAETTLRDGDVMEVVTLVGGG
jgi:thiamine biosynthesis protein ThiS